MKTRAPPDQGDALRIAVISIDPSRRKSGGALLGDRIRMNAIAPWNNEQRVFMRSLATRSHSQTGGSEISAALHAARTSGSAWLISLPKSRVARLRM